MSLTDAAKYYKELPHQKVAWEALESRPPKPVVEKFMKAGSGVDIRNNTTF